MRWSLLQTQRVVRRLGAVQVLCSPTCEQLGRPRPSGVVRRDVGVLKTTAVVTLLNGTLGDG